MSPLLPTLTDPPPIQKCTVTRGQLPLYIDPIQPPTKRKPIATLFGLKYCHQIDLLLPTKLTQTVKDHLHAHLTAAPNTNANNTPSIHYAKLFLTLPDILTGPFFTTYIKTRTVILRSEGRLGIDPVYALFNGTLTLHLPKSTYERTGLVGKPIELGGPKHQKAWYVIQIDLRQPSMVHGKRGFERLVWAARNVLGERRMWVFGEVPTTRGKKRDADGKTKDAEMNDAETEEIKPPIEEFHPTWCEARPLDNVMEDVVVPKALEEDVWKVRSPEVSEGEHGANAMGVRCDEREVLEEILEYLSLVGMDSLRVRAKDKVDPYICRYDFPSADDRIENEEVGRTGSLTRLRWTGFLPCQSFGLSLVLAVKGTLEEQQLKKRTDGGDGAATSSSANEGLWATIAMHAIDGEAVTLLMKNGGCHENLKAFANGTHDPSEHGTADSKADEATQRSVVSQRLEEDAQKTVEKDHEHATNENEPNGAVLKEGSKSRKSKSPKLSSIGFVEWSHQSCLLSLQSCA